MATYYAAVDMGASSGRLILDIWKTERWSLKKSIVSKMVWLRKTENSVGNSTEFLQKSLTGLKKCKEIGKIPVSMVLIPGALTSFFLTKKTKYLETL